MAPAKSPETPSGPNKIPITIGVKITKRPGATIFLREALVEIAMHLS